MTIQTSQWRSNHAANGIEEHNETESVGQFLQTE